MDKIYFNVPSVMGHEIDYLMEVLRGDHWAGDGYFTKKCNDLLEKSLGIPKALLTTSCTHALEMSALLLDIRPGDEVIVPSFTFVTTVNAYVLRGARPVFIDIKPDTLNLDETQLESRITSYTKAIIPVHYAGVGCEMDVITDIADRHNIPVVEDNAHGLFGKYKGKYLGTFGAMATQSFHETKNFTCGEGGALLINDPQYIDRAEIIREKGTDRSRFFRGQVDKYGWVDYGSSYLPSEILAAVLLAQLEEREQIQLARKWIWDYYFNNLEEWATTYDVRLPRIPPECEQPYHMFYLIMPTLDSRQEFISYLKANEINCVFHYLPLHLSKMGRDFEGKEGDCPVTEKISDCLVRLPFHNKMTETELSRVVDTIKKYRL